MQLGCGITLCLVKFSCCVSSTNKLSVVSGFLRDIKNLRTSLVHTAVRMSAKNAGGTNLVFGMFCLFCQSLVLVIWAICD